jgi:hypothetical protein
VHSLARLMRCPNRARWARKPDQEPEGAPVSARARKLRWGEIGMRSRGVLPSPLTNGVAFLFKYAQVRLPLAKKWTFLLKTRGPCAKVLSLDESAHRDI